MNTMPHVFSLALAFLAATMLASPASERKVNSLGEPRPAFKLKVPEDGEGRLDGTFIQHDGRLVSGTVLGAQVATADGNPEPIVIPIPDDLPRCNCVRISPDGKWQQSVIFTMEASNQGTLNRWPRPLLIAVAVATILDGARAATYSLVDDFSLEENHAGGVYGKVHSYHHDRSEK